MSDELRHLSGCFEFRQVAQKHLGALDVGVAQVESAVVQIRDRSKCGIADAASLDAAQFPAGRLLHE
jgi:hypothetical protein